MMITPIEPKIGDSDRYTVTQTCAVLGIHRNTLLKHTAIGLIKCKFRSNGRKFYLGREILRYWRASL